MNLTQKELAIRWGCSERTVKRNIREFKLQPVAMRGQQPFFDLEDVEAMERRRLEARAQQIGLPVASDRVLSVKEAKRRAGAGRKEVAK